MKIRSNTLALSRFGRSLAVATILFVVQTTASAHEIEHAFHDHDAHCALSLHVGQLSGVPLSQSPVIQTNTATLAIPVIDSTQFRSCRIRAYASRAPPPFSV